MVGGGQDSCPVYHPTKDLFSRPFTEFVANVLEDDPNMAMFKVVPPKSWRARAEPFPSLDGVNISCPIRQIALGKQGSYRCYFVEQKKSTAAEFEKLCEREHAKTPPKDRRDDEFRERAFWSSVTITPPCYGADTPQSFFDEKIPFGWNLRDLGDLLKKYPVPCIPGVTYPMTYFGMWKAFFAWHVEDADLFSINYMHFGAGKVWYCVSPEEREKFDQMAESIFPDLHRECKAFMRHKDILLSPHVLRSYGIKYTQAKQEPGEFIVLNAGAYHSGFNLGFNCAEAVNFATEAWLPLGASASRCTCRALRDSVRISMEIFDGPPSGTPVLDAPKNVSKSRKSSEDKVEKGGAVEKKRKKSDATKVSTKGPISSHSSKGKGAKAKTESNEDVAAPITPLKKQKKMRCLSAQERSRQKTESAPKQETNSIIKRQVMQKRQVRTWRAWKPLGQSTSLGLGGGALDVPEDCLLGGANSPGNSECDTEWHELITKAQLKPMAIVGEEEGTKARYFYLVACLGEGKEGMMVQWLKEGTDGLFRAANSTWTEDPSALVKVRTQWVQPTGDMAGGYRLLTLRRRILDTVLV